MHTGNQPPFAGGLAQQDLPGTPGLFRIDVEGDRGFWPRRLNGREMDDIPPDQQRRSARLEARSEEHTSELQSLTNLVCRLLLEKKKKKECKMIIGEGEENEQ